MATPFDHELILDTGGTPEDPLSQGGNWIPIAGDLVRWLFQEIRGPQTQPTIYSESLWGREQFTDCAFTMISGNWGLLSDLLQFKVRASADAVTDYYQGRMTETGFDLSKSVGGVVTSLGSTGSNLNFQVFDRFGMAAIGSTISVWKQDHLGSPGDPNYGPNVITDGWHQVISVTDTDLPGPGYMTIAVQGIETEIYNVSGGSVPSAGALDATFMAASNPATADTTAARNLVGAFAGDTNPASAAAAAKTLKARFRTT